MQHFRRKTKDFKRINNAHIVQFLRKHFKHRLVKHLLIVILMILTLLIINTILSSADKLSAKSVEFIIK